MQLFNLPAGACRYFVFTYLLSCALKLNDDDDDDDDESVYYLGRCKRGSFSTLSGTLIDWLTRLSVCYKIASTSPGL